MQKLNFKSLTYCILGGGCKLIKTPQGIKKVATGESRTYNVGNMTFEQIQSKGR